MFTGKRERERYKDMLLSLKHFIFTHFTTGNYSLSELVILIVL